MGPGLPYPPLTQNIFLHFLCSFHTNPFDGLGRYARLIERWQHHAAAVGVFLVWGELMLMIGRLPTFGIYVQMFTTVAKNFAKFLAAYFCLLVRLVNLEFVYPLIR